jgi:hypothetical protein
MGTLERDREDWLGYVTATLAEYNAYSNHASPWSDRYPLTAIPRSLRAIVNGFPVDGFAGAWHVVRKYAAPEFVRFFEGEMRERITFAEWRERATAVRERDAMQELDYLESSEYCLDRLADLRELLAIRDELIMSARARGATWSAIGTAVGLSRAQLHNVATRHTPIAAPQLLGVGPGGEEVPF